MKSETRLFCEILLCIRHKMSINNEESIIPLSPPKHKLYQTNSEKIYHISEENLSSPGTYKTRTPRKLINYNSIHTVGNTGNTNNNQNSEESFSANADSPTKSFHFNFDKLETKYYTGIPSSEIELEFSRVNPAFKKSMKLFSYRDLQEAT